MILRNLHRGLEILAKYRPDEIVEATHDTVYFGPDTPDMTDADRAELMGLGFRVDSSSYWYAGT